MQQKGEGKKSADMIYYTDKPEKRHEQRQRSRSIWELRFVPQGIEEEDSDFMFLY